MSCVRHVWRIWKSDRPTDIQKKSLTGVASVGTFDAGITAQPSSAINKFMANAIEKLIGELP